MSETPAENFDALWESVPVGSLVLRNRVVVTAHRTNHGTRHTANEGLTERNIAYLEARAAGGAALVISGGTVPHPSGESFGHRGIWEEASIAPYNKLADAVHRHGSHVFVQLFHTGPQDWGVDNLENWHPPFAASDLPSPVANRIPKPMELADIRSVTDSFGVAAARLRKAGVDGVEISAGHGYLLHTFLSPLTNRREDDYGGDVAGRCRIIHEILQSIREQAGRDFPVGIRLSFEDYLPGGIGITQEIAEEIVKELHSGGLLDLLSVSGGTYPTNTMMIPPSIGEMGTHFAGHGLLAQRLVGAEMPVLVAAGARTLADACRLVDDGAADLVAMTRAHIADPELVNKARDGRAAEIRRCVGANQGCVRRVGRRLMLSCTVNPQTGREVSIRNSTPPESPLDVLVVGGGPAGMKAAESAAERGHGVTLVEREEVLGGQLQLAGRLRGRKVWHELIADLAASVRRLGVELRLGEELGADDVIAIGADRVVLATGSHYRTAGFSGAAPVRGPVPGADLPHVLGPELAIADRGRLGKNVVIFDETGGIMPLILARELQEEQHLVHFVTPRLHAGEEILWTLEFPWVYPTLKQSGALVHEQTLIGSIDSDSVVLASVWGVGEDIRVEADSVVLIGERSSERKLYDALLEHGVAVDRIGDCQAPRDVDDAINDGYRWGLELAPRTETAGGLR